MKRCFPFISNFQQNSYFNENLFKEILEYNTMSSRFYFSVFLPKIRFLTSILRYDLKILFLFILSLPERVGLHFVIFIDKKI